MKAVSLLSCLLALACATGAHAADGSFAKKHPRRAQVLNRANRQQNANNSAEATGKLNEKQANRLDGEDAKIKAQEQADAKANGGTITKSEQQGLNREENRVNRQRKNMETADKNGTAGQFAKNHPRRAEVLKRDNNEKAANDSAEATGKITGAQANQLNREDNRIRRQEQRDAKANGGSITAAEQQGLNREENRVNQQRSNMEKADAAAAPAPAPTPAPAAQ